MASHPQHSGDQLVLLGEVIPLRPLRTVVSFGDLFVAFGLGASTMNALVATGSRRTGSRGPRHRRGSALSAAVPSPIDRPMVADEADLQAPFADAEIRRVVTLLDDERSVIDLTSAPGGTIDAVELSARYAVRQSLERHGLPDHALHAPTDQSG